MKTTNYLLINDVIAKHYVVVEVLAKDAFEILYLVRDSNREGSFFVLKELFFETFCSREGKIVIIEPQAQGFFYKQKQEIIAKVNKVKNHHEANELKTFGYIEENNTIYTIMEYSTEAEMSDYLEFETEIPKQQPTKKSSIDFKKFLKYILPLGLLLIMGVLGFLAYTYFNQSKETNEESLKPKVKLRDYSEKNDSQKPLPSKVIEDKIIKNIVENNQTTHTPAPVKPLLVKEENLTLEVNQTTIETNESIEKKSTALQLIVEELTQENNINKEENQTEAISSVNDENKSKTLVTEKEIELFLNTYINASAKGSADEIANFYDKKVEKYFKLTHITPNRIKKDKVTYNKKWVHREFSIIDFKILKRYQKNAQEFVHLQTKTQWSISNKKGFKRKGTSKGFMKLILTDDGLKIVSIYGLQ